MSLRELKFSDQIQEEQVKSVYHKNFNYVVTDSKGVIYKNSDNLENLLNNINWKKLQK